MAIHLVLKNATVYGQGRYAFLPYTHLSYMENRQRRHYGKC